MTQIIHDSAAADFRIRLLDPVDPFVVHQALAGMGFRVELTQSLPTLPLSPRERQVLEGIAAGHPDKRIAFDLGIRPRTVRYHLQRIIEKLGASNRTSAAVKAQAYLLSPGEAGFPGGDLRSETAGRAGPGC